MIEQVTVAVPVHGDPTIVLPLLRALDEQAAGRGRLRVLVSDDASPRPIGDGIDPSSFASIDVSVLRSERNRGPGGARNVALSVVTTPSVAFLDADVVPLAGWLDALLRIVDDSASADLVEGRVVIPGDDPATPFTHATEAEPPAQRVAANMVFRTSVLRDVGGFDERFYDAERKLHFREDAELAFRLDAAGARIGYDPELLVAHPPLPSSFWSPIRLARRYHFDPLLDREHPAAFRSMNAHRTIGPVSLRGARHHAATLLVAGVLAAVVGGVARLRVLLVPGLLAVAAGWAANVVSLCWRRTVRPSHVLPVLAASFLAPWVYLWHYWRGVVRFRHRPRL
jgi:glycosyltransferase involved in cell wall biosynthesis